MDRQRWNNTIGRRQRRVRQGVQLRQQAVESGWDQATCGHEGPSAAMVQAVMGQKVSSNRVCLVCDESRRHGSTWEHAVQVVEPKQRRAEEALSKLRTEGVEAEVVPMVERTTHPSRRKQVIRRITLTIQDEQEHQGYVYLAQEIDFLVNAGGHLKIGFSVEPQARLGELQGGNPRPLRLLATQLGTRADEQDMHARFAHVRIRGEWFYSTPAIFEAFGLGAGRAAAPATATTARIGGTYGE